MIPFEKKSLPRKVLLTGSDCFHLVLDKHAQTHHAGSNVMRLVFYFNNSLPVEKFRNAILGSALIHWLCNIKLQNPRFGIPCWRYEDKGNSILINELHHPIVNDIPGTILERDLPLRGERFIEADIIHYPGNKTSFVLSWNHILMDGKGIAMLVQHLNEPDSNHPAAVLFPGREKSTGLMSHIKNMYAVKRFIEASSQAPIVSVADKNSESHAAFKNRIIYFTPEETKKIDEYAVESGARFGANLYYLACSAHAVSQVTKQRKKEGAMWIPVPYDGRLRGAFGPIISNTVAFLFYRIPKTVLGNPKETVASLSVQMTDQIKEKMPLRYGMLLNLMRHIPLRIYYYLVNSRSGGSFASFLYSSTGETFNNIRTVFGETMERLTIFPSPTFPPGLTFSFLKHRDALNINIAYSLDIVDNFELDTIELGLKNLLLKKSQ